jgi:predicted outer membrane repeat protein
VAGNHAQYHGGGILNSGFIYNGIRYYSTLTLEAGSSVTGNTAGTTGGGISTTDPLTLAAGSHVSGNVASDGGGVFVASGVVHVADTSIVVNNTPNNCAGAVAETCMGCAPAYTNCGGECVDTRLENDHCGGCGQICDQGSSCVDGVCLPWQ